jgi:deazaflavin-dependent oxidoreductase (nitroreductase family)
MRRVPDVVYRAIGWIGRSRFVTRLHPVLYRLTGGRGIVGRSLGMRIVVLTTTGRRSGQPRTAPLYAIPAGEAWLLVGTHGGEEKLPDWVANLRAQPDAELRLGSTTQPVRAREPEAAEYGALWERATSIYPGYAVYRARRSSDPPLILLERRGIG